MHISRLLVSAVCAVVVVMVAGCSSSSQGQATGATTADATSAAVPSGANNPATATGAPRVQHPLAVTKFEQEPCAMLTSDQLRQLGVIAREQPDNTALFWGCVWNDSNGPTGAFIGPALSKGGNGLGSIYANRDSLKLFQPIPDIEGYPAVIAASIDARTQGQCAVDIGVRDDVALDINIQMRGGVNPAPNYANPCGVAETVAKAVMITLKGGI